MPGATFGKLYDPSDKTIAFSTTSPLLFTKTAFNPPAFVPVPFTVLSVKPLASLNTFPLKVKHCLTRIETVSVHVPLVHIKPYVPAALNDVIFVVALFEEDIVAVPG